jgi:integrase
MSQLPRFLFQSKTGIYRYRRTVPEACRPALGVREIKKALGKDYATALKRYAAVHREAEEGLRNAAEGATPTTRDEVITLLRKAGLTRQQLDLLVSDSATKDLREGLSFIADELADEYESDERSGRDPRVSIEAIRAINTGQIPPQTHTLASALEFYLSLKSGDDAHKNRQIENRVSNLKGRMISAIGNEAVTRRSLQRCTRQDATRIRDALLAEGLDPNSVKRMLNILKAAVNKTILENGLDVRNWFERLEIKGAGERRDSRHPLSEDDLRSLAPVMARGDDDDLGTIWAVLRDTGARVSEVCRLRTLDVRLEDVPHVHIPFGKSRNAERAVPLSPDASERMRLAIKGKGRNDPVFPQYARGRGNDAASQALMKRLRTVIDEPKKTVHSLRHRMKDCLRNTSCPESVAKEIMGHARQSVADNYGLGTALGMKRDALKKVWKTTPK